MHACPIVWQPVLDRFRRHLMAGFDKRYVCVLLEQLAEMSVDNKFGGLFFVTTNSHKRLGTPHEKRYPRYCPAQASISGIERIAGKRLALTGQSTISSLLQQAAVKAPGKSKNPFQLCSLFYYRFFRCELIVGIQLDADARVSCRISIHGGRWLISHFN